MRSRAVSLPRKRCRARRSPPPIRRGRAAPRARRAAPPTRPVRERSARRVDTRREDGHPQMLFSNHIRGKRATVNFDEDPVGDAAGLVRGVADGFGHEYFAECTRTDTRTDALWQAVADLGFLAVHLPEAWRRWRRRHHCQLTVVCEELAAAVPAPPHPRVRRDLRRARGEVRHRRAVPNLAAAARHRDEDGVRDHRARRGLEQPSPHHHRDARRRCATACAAKTFISGVDESAAILVVAHRHARRRRSRALSLFIVDADAPGLTRTIIPVEIRAPEKQYTLFFDDVQVGADRLRRGGRRPAPGVRRPQSRAHHERGDLQRHRPLRARSRRACRARSRGVGRAHRAASRHRAPARRGEDRRRARADDVQGGVGPRPVRRRCRRR